MRDSSGCVISECGAGPTSGSNVRVQRAGHAAGRSFRDLSTGVEQSYVAWLPGARTHIVAVILTPHDRNFNAVGPSRLDLTRFRGPLTRPSFGAEVAHGIEQEGRPACELDPLLWSQWGWVFQPRSIVRHAPAQRLTGTADHARRAADARCTSLRWSGRP